jgi:hypothetical protein
MCVAIKTDWRGNEPSTVYVVTRTKSFGRFMGNGARLALLPLGNAAEAERDAKLEMTARARTLNVSFIGFVFLNVGRSAVFRAPGFTVIVSFSGRPTAFRVGRL